MVLLRYKSSHRGTLPAGLLLVVLSSVLVLEAAVQSSAFQDKSNPSQVMQNLDQGKVLAAQGRFAEAEVPLTEAVRLAPTNTEALQLLGKIKARTGQQAEAISLLRKAILIRPGAAQDHVDLAIALADAGQLNEALKETGNALSLSPGLSSAHLNRARIPDDLHQAREARKEFAIVCQLSPKNADAVFYWALLERENGDFAKEAALLRKLVTLRPENAEAFFFLGRSLSGQSKNSEAIAAFRAALDIDPDMGEALYALSRKLQQSNPEESRELMQHFLTVRQNNTRLDASRVLGNEAYVASGHESWPEAIRLLRQALETCGGCSIRAGLHRNLGLALCRNGDLQEGVTELQTALQLNPNDPDVVKALDVLAR